MKMYTSKCKFHCGIDLHKHSMYICLVDNAGKKLRHCNIPGNDFSVLAEYLKPCKGDVDICCEATYNWFRVADYCFESHIEFVLAHAAYLRAIAIDKKKTDKEDCFKIAQQLRTSMIPTAWPCPNHWRPYRSYLRNRIHMVQERSRHKCRLVAFEDSYHLQAENSGESTEELLAQAWKNPGGSCLRKDYLYRLRHIDSSTELIEEIDKEMARFLKKEKLFNEDYQLLLSIPGFGPTFAAVVLLESGPIGRFHSAQNYSSYSGVVQCIGESAGKNLSVRGKKNCNSYLKWAFGEAARRATNNSQMKFFFEDILRKHNNRKREAYAVLRNKLCRCVYFMLKNKKPFDLMAFYGDDNCRRFLKLDPDKLRKLKATAKKEKNETKNKTRK